jgi:hypothetical protein
MHGDQNDKSPVTGDCHAGICGSRRVKLPPATRLSVGAEADLPVVVVHDPVVVAAQEDTVVDVGLAADQPGHDVMRLGPAGRAIAAREGTPAIP